jgi:hypothetical protein
MVCLYMKWNIFKAFRDGVFMYQAECVQGLPIWCVYVSSGMCFRPSDMVSFLRVSARGRVGERERERERERESFIRNNLHENVCMHVC